MMFKITLVLLLILAPFAWAQSAIIPQEYFITVDQVGSYFETPEPLIDQSFKKYEVPFSSNLYKANQSGFFKNKTIYGNTVYIFVSPFPSIHSERTDHNWYRTQFDTDTVSNCGPSIVSMAIGWAKGKYVPVSQLRSEIGFNDRILGATSLNELVDSAQRYGIEAKRIPEATLDQIDHYIRNDHLLGVVYQTGEVTYNPKAGTDLVGRHFKDVVGHYTIIKGITKDKKYLIVNDPIPSNWYNNSFRHADGKSMLGQNRYYPAEEFIKAIVAGRDMILFSRDRNAKAPIQNIPVQDHWKSMHQYVQNPKEKNAFYHLCISKVVSNEIQHTIKTLLDYLDAKDCEQGYRRALNTLKIKIEKTDISSLAPLAGFTNLVSLTLGGNHFSDLAPLGSLENLQYLQLWGSKIENILPLKELSSLKAISFWGKLTNDVSPLLHLENLERVEIWGSSLKSISTLIFLPKIKSLYLNNKREHIPHYLTY